MILFGEFWGRKNRCHQSSTPGFVGRPRQCLSTQTFGCGPLWDHCTWVLKQKYGKPPQIIHLFIGFSMK